MPPFASESTAAAAFKAPSSLSRPSNKGPHEPTMAFASLIDDQPDSFLQGNDGIPPKPPMSDHAGASASSSDEASAGTPDTTTSSSRSRSKATEADEAQNNDATNATSDKPSESETSNQAQKSDDTNSSDDTKSGDSQNTGACKSADATAAPTTVDAVADSPVSVPQAVAAPVTPVVVAAIAPALTQASAPSPDSTKPVCIDDKGNAANRAATAQATLQMQVKAQADTPATQGASGKSSDENPETIPEQKEAGDTQAAAPSDKQQRIQSLQNSIQTGRNSIPDSVTADAQSNANAGTQAPGAAGAANNSTVGNDDKTNAAKTAAARIDGNADAASRSNSTQPMLSMQLGSDIHLTGLAGSPQAQQIQSASNPSAPSATLAPAAIPIAGLAVEIAGRALAGKNHFEIRLDPPELGRIDVHLSVDRNGQVTSHLVVDRSDTLNLLRQDSSGLQRALQDAGLRTSDNGLQFSLRDQTMNQNPAPQPMPLPPTRVIVPDEGLAAIDIAPRVYSRVAGMGGGLDIRV